MRTRPLRMRQITWPACRGSQTITFFVCSTPFCLFTMQHWWLYDEGNSKVEHVAVFTAIFSNICNAHAQKRLFMNFRCKFWHRRSIRRPRFPVWVLNFVDLATFSVEFCILYSECPPCFYFRFVWHTDLKSIPHASTPSLKLIWPSAAELQRFCLLIRHVTCYVTFVFLTLNSCHTWRVTWSTLPPSMKTLRLFVYELRVITVPVDYRRKCVCGHCACAESRHPWVEGQKRLHFWNPRPRFAYLLYNLYWVTTTIKGRLLSSVTNAKALIAYISCAWPCDLDLWPFDLEQFSYMMGHVTHPATEFENPKTIRSCVTFITFPID